MKSNNVALSEESSSEIDFFLNKPPGCDFRQHNILSDCKNTKQIDRYLYVE